MNEENKQPKQFSLDGKEYDVDNVSETARYFVFNLNKVNQKRLETESELTILNAAEQSLISELRKALEEKPEEEEEKETGA